MNAPASLSTARRRWSLRARLIALVLAVAAVALIAVDLVLPLSIRASLIADRDATLTSVVQRLPPGLIDERFLSALSNSDLVRGEIGWSVIGSTGIGQVRVHPSRDPDGNPSLGRNPVTSVPITVGDSSRPPARYRAIAIGTEDPVSRAPSGYLVAWISLADVTAAVNRLIFLELLVTGGLLLLLGATASLIIRRDLMPLEVMAHAADEIAAGDLAQRVEVADPGTEIHRLGTAFNGMLDGIGELLQERRRSEDRLRQFVSDASHELRTPVAAVRGYTELYRAGALPDAASVSRAMERMGFEAGRMSVLVDDLLTLMKADAEQPASYEPVDLSQLLVGVVDDAAVIDGSRTWRLIGASGPCVVLGDRLRLHQLFANLLSNVRTHTPPGTTAAASLLPGRQEVAVTITDNGPGVPADALPRLFDRFFRADSARSRHNGGSGLGLSIVAAIVRSHGGWVFASHAQPNGLTVTVVLPMAVGTAAVPGLSSPASPVDDVAGTGSGGSAADGVHPVERDVHPASRVDPAVDPQRRVASDL